MDAEKIQANVEEALNVETFNVLEYLDGQPVAEDEIKVYASVKETRKLAELLEERELILKRRNKQDNKDRVDDLSIADEDEDTELDDEINALIAELDKTALYFEVTTVAPKLVRSIEDHYTATLKSDATPEEKTKHAERKTADILARAIASVRTGNGQVDPAKWDADRLMQLERRLYESQAQHLIAALYNIVYTGEVFEEALTVDF